ELVGLRPVFSEAGKMDALTESQSDSQRFEGTTTCAVSDEHNVNIRPLRSQQCHGAQENCVVLDRAQIGHRSDNPRPARYSQRSEQPGALLRGERCDGLVVHKIGDYDHLLGWKALDSAEPVTNRPAVCQYSIGEASCHPVYEPLCAEGWPCPPPPAGDHDRGARESRPGGPEDIAIEVMGVQNVHGPSSQKGGQALALPHGV